MHYTLKNLIIIIFAISFLYACASKQKDITKEQVFKLCQDKLYTLVGSDSTSMEIIFYPDHVITLDSIESRKVPNSSLWDPGWFIEARPILKDKSFWKLLFKFKEPTVGDGWEIYIDAKTGLILKLDR